MKRTILLSTAVLLSLFSVSILAEATNSIEADVYVACVSKYLSRGMVAYGHPAIQPGFDLTMGGLSLGFWSSIHLGPSGSADPDRELANGNRFCEADVTVSYEQSFPFCDKLSLNSGFTFYVFPNTDDQTVEIFSGIGWDGFLSPKLTVWHDPALGNGTYIEAEISREWKLGLDWSATLTAGYNYRQWGYDPSFTAAGLTIEPSYEFGHFTITAKIFGQYALNKQYFTKSVNGFDWYAGLSCQYDY